MVRLDSAPQRWDAIAARALTRHSNGWHQYFVLLPEPGWSPDAVLSVLGGEAYLADAQKFLNAPKLGPALVYDRVLPPGVSASEAAKRMFPRPRAKLVPLSVAREVEPWRLLRRGVTTFVRNLLGTMPAAERQRVLDEVRRLTDAGDDEGRAGWLGWLVTQGQDAYAARREEDLPDDAEWDRGAGEAVVRLPQTMAEYVIETPELTTAVDLDHGIVPEVRTPPSRLAQWAAQDGYRGDLRDDDWYREDAEAGWFSARALLELPDGLHEIIEYAKVPAGRHVVDTLREGIRERFGEVHVVAFQPHDPQTSVGPRWTAILEVPTPRSASLSEILDRFYLDQPATE